MTDPPSIESLAYAFYGGVPWEKLTLAEQELFTRYVQERNENR